MYIQSFPSGMNRDVLLEPAERSKKSCCWVFEHELEMLEKLANPLSSPMIFGTIVIHRQSTSLSERNAECTEAPPSTMMLDMTNESRSRFSTSLSSNRPSSSHWHGKSSIDYAL